MPHAPTMFSEGSLSRVDLECDIPAVLNCSVVPLTFGSEFPKDVEFDMGIPVLWGQRHPFNSCNPLEKEEEEARRES